MNIPLPYPLPHISIAIGSIACASPTQTAMVATQTAVVATQTRVMDTQTRMMDTQTLVVDTQALMVVTQTPMMYTHNASVSNYFISNGLIINKIKTPIRVVLLLFRGVVQYQ